MNSVRSNSLKHIVLTPSDYTGMGMRKFEFVAILFRVRRVSGYKPLFFLLTNMYIFLKGPSTNFKLSSFPLKSYITLIQTVTGKGVINSLQTYCKSKAYTISKHIKNTKNTKINMFRSKYIV